MALVQMQREFESAIPVRFEDVFSQGAFVAGDVVMAKDWDRSSKNEDVQGELEVPDVSGELRRVRLWLGTLQDSNGEQFPLRILADHRPVLPAPVLAGLRPVELEGLGMASVLDKGRCKPPWGDNDHRCGARLEVRYWALGVREPAGHSAGEAA